MLQFIQANKYKTTIILPFIFACNESVVLSETPKVQVEKEEKVKEEEPPKTIEELSKQAAPPWGEFEPIRNDTDLIWASLPAKQENVNEGFIFCKISKHPDSVYSLELAASVKNKKRRQYGFSSDAPVGFSYPALKSGDVIDFSFSTSGVLLSYDYGDFTFTWNGTFPLGQKEKKPNIECRALPIEKVQEQVDQDVEKAKDKLQSFQPSVDLSEGDGGFKSSGVKETLQYVSNVAALVGWNDPKVQELLPQAKAVVEQFNSELKNNCQNANDWVDIGNSNVKVKINSVENTLSSSRNKPNGKFKITLEFEANKNKGFSASTFLFFEYGHRSNLMLLSVNGQKQDRRDNSIPITPGESTIAELENAYLEEFEGHPRINELIKPRGLRINIWDINVNKNIYLCLP